MVKYFNTEAEYLAFAKPTTESSVSLVGDGNSVHFDGVNVVIGLPLAKTGAAAVLKDGVLNFINPESFYAVPDGWTFVGPVLVGVDHEDYRGKVVLGNKDDTNAIMSYAYSFLLTGYTLDGTARTGVLNVRDSSAWGAPKAYTVSYNATTANGLVEQLNSFFKDTSNPVFQDQDWVAVADSEGNISLVFHYLDYRQASNTGSSGFTLTGNVYPDVVATSAMLRYNGQRTGEGCCGNMPRLLTYFRQDLNNASYNPTTTQTAAGAKRSYPICLPGYLGSSQYSGGEDRCAAIRAIYGEGEDGWKKYMATFYPVKPTKYGSIGDKDTYGDGYTNSHLMAGLTYTGQDGTAHAYSPAADYVTSISYNHPLLGKGLWGGMDSDVVSSTMKTIQYGTTNNRDADEINRTLRIGGGSAISNGATLWSFSRFAANTFWFFYGSNGYLRYYDLYNSLRVRPVVLLDVSKANN